MSVEIRVPALGESVVEATILRWLKQAGETVSSGEPLVELETDKVNVEVPADQAGVLERVNRQEGETVSVGDLLGTLADADGKPAPPSNGQSQAGSAGGGAAAQPQGRAAAAGGAPAGSGQAEQPRESAPGAGGIAERQDAHASPLARKLAEENGLDLRLVSASGAGGKITKEDVATYLERSAEAPATANRLAQQAVEPPSPPVETLKPPSTGGPPARTEERIRISRLRHTIMSRLKEAQNTAAMLTTFNEADMSAVMEIRKRRKDAFKERYGVGLGFMSFFTKAAVGALKAFPYVNAEIQGEEIVLKRYYDIGIAVSTEKGLVVPVLRDADRLTFAEIEKGVLELATRAREGRLTLPELQGGTFTITNGGVFGSLMSTPILNTPQVGILGMHKIQERPIAVGGQVAIRPMMYLALSYDHRIVDGSEAVRFLVRIKELIEDPASLLLEG